MRIILEGTEAELRSALHSFGISNEVAFNDGSQFLCGDIAGRGHRQKVVELAKEHSDRRRQVREQLNSLSEQAIPEAVTNYFKGNKLSVSFEKR